MLVNRFNNAYVEAVSHRWAQKLLELWPYPAFICARYVLSRYERRIIFMIVSPSIIKIFTIKMVRKTQVEVNKYNNTQIMLRWFVVVMRRAHQSDNIIIFLFCLIFFFFKTKRFSNIRQWPARLIFTKQQHHQDLTLYPLSHRLSLNPDHVILIIVFRWTNFYLLHYGLWLRARLMLRARMQFDMCGDNRSLSFAGTLLLCCQR